MQIKNRIIDAYSTEVESWGDLPNFVGNLINFGYWKDILEGTNEQNITYPERMASAINLYELLAKELVIQSTDNVLEVGCGRGMGAIHIGTNHRPNRIVGVDITASQIKIANQITSHQLREKFNISFLNAELENATFHEAEFDKIYSVEVFQHIPIESLKKVVKILQTILKPGGTFAITTYFTKEDLKKSEIENLFPLVREGQEHLYSIENFKSILSAAGFESIKNYSIGEYVFNGYNQWISQQHVDTPCSYVYHDLYSKNILDYYVVTAKKA